MKKFYLLLSLVALMCCPMAKAQTIVLSESFESGKISSQWSQECVTKSDTVLWKVESLSEYEYPSVKIGGRGDGGGNYRAYLRNTTGQTIGYTTRLISPAMRLDTVNAPILRFFYAQDKWTADFDTLRILYRTSSSDHWSLLKEFPSAVTRWTKVSVELPSPSKEYQIAFEGSDNLGRGIVLDSIQVRSQPQCEIPHDAFVTNMVNGQAAMGWQANYDAEQFQIILATTLFDPDTLEGVDPAVMVKNLTIDAEYPYHYNFTEMERGAYYYFYVRSICESENSDWYEYSFRMNAFENIPYSESFNTTYTGKPSQFSAWTWGTDMQAVTPFVASNMTNGECRVYSNDGTMMLAFAGNAKCTSPLGAGRYAFAVTPELAGTPLKDCQVSFWSTIYTFTNRKYARSLLVGVMTDPEDISTLVVVDTVRMNDFCVFQENIVSLEKYTGTGRYVALVSRFDQPNMFFVDNLTIEARPAIVKPTQVTVVPSADKAAIAWQGNAASYQIMVTNVKTNQPDTITSPVYSGEVNANNTVVTALEAGHLMNRPYYVNVRGINGANKGAWSEPVAFITPAKTTVAQLEIAPMNWDMELTAGTYYTLPGDASVRYPNNLAMFSNGAENAHIIGNSAFNGGAALYLSKEKGTDAWFILPEVDDIQGVQLTFYLTGKDNPVQTSAVVGVMTNPMDIATFEPVASFSCRDEAYMRCYTSFKDYKGQGHIIAVMYKDLDVDAPTTNYIDDMSLEKMGECMPSTDLVALPTDSSAALSWAMGSGARWQVVVAESRLNETQLNGDLSTNRYVIVNTEVNTPNLQVKDLHYATTYYYYVRTLCNSSEAIWSNECMFTTNCPELIKLPYAEGFETYGVGKNSKVSCWYSENATNYSPAGEHYPYISTDNATFEGGASLYMFSSTAYGSFIVAPKMNSAINDMVVFYSVMSTEPNSQILVGTVSTPDNYQSFEVIDTVKLADVKIWEQHVLDLSQYTGANQYVAFSTMTGTTNSCYLDDVTFRSVVCGAAFNIESAPSASDALNLVWGGKTTDKWQVVVCSKAATLADNTLTLPAAASVICDTLVTANSVRVVGLQPKTNYYVYIRPTCGDQPWVSEIVMTECIKIDPHLAFVENFDSYPSGTSYNASYANVPCWTLVNYNPKASTSYYPYVYKGNSKSGSNSLRMYGYHSSATTSYTPVWVATPEIDVNSLTQVMLNFSLYSTNAAQCIWIIGVMGDPTDLSTFVTLDSLSGSASVHYDLSYDMADYADMITDQKYLAIRTPIGRNGQIYLDDISVIMGDCKQPKPVVNTYDQTTATIASGLRVNSDWRLIVTDKQVTETALNNDPDHLPSGTTIILDTVVDASRATFKIKDLSPSTNYYVSVATVCQNAFSAWKQVSFKTLCNSVTPEELGTVSFEKTEGFTSGSTDLGCWVGGSAAGSDIATTYMPQITTTNAHSGSQALQLYSYDYSSISAGGAYAIMPTLNVDDISKYQVSFYANSYYNVGDLYPNSMTVGVISDPSDLATFKAVDTVYSSKEFAYYTVSFENYKGDDWGDKGKNIIFICDAPLINRWFIDEVKVEPVSPCVRPRKIRADSIGAEGVKLSWVGNAETYNVMLNIDENVPDSMRGSHIYTIDTLVHGNSVVIEGLKPVHRYFAFVNGHCSATESQISLENYDFWTTCLEKEPMPFLATFDDNTVSGSGTLPDCWIGYPLTPAGGVYSTTSTLYPMVDPSAASNGSTYGVALRGNATAYRSVLITPELDVEELGNYTLTFEACEDPYYPTTVSVLTVGVVDVTEHTEFATHFVPLKKFMVHTNFETFVMDLAPYAEQVMYSKRIAFVLDAQDSHTSYSGIFMDNVHILKTPDCLYPELNVTSTTINSIKGKVTRIDPQGTNNWQVAVLTEDQYKNLKNDSEIEKIAKLYSGSTETFEADGLEMGTCYYVYARLACSKEGAYSDWTAPVNVYTTFTCNDGFFYGFEKSEGWMRSIRSSSDTYFIHPSLKTGNLSNTKKQEGYPYQFSNTPMFTFSHTGNSTLIVRTDGSMAGAYVIFPTVITDQARKFTFDIRPGYASTDGPMYDNMTPASCMFTIGLVDKFQGMETFEPISDIIFPDIQGKTPTEDNNWLFQRYVFNLSAETMANKQVVILNNNNKSLYLCVDNARMDEASDWGTPLFSKMAFADTSATFTWLDYNGPWNLYVYEGTYAYGQAPADKIAFKAEDLTVTSMTVTTLKSQTHYTAYLVSANAPADTKAVIYDTRSFTTACDALPLDARGQITFTFDDDIEMIDSDPLYMKASCWNHGSTLLPIDPKYNFLVQRSGYNYTGAATAGATYNPYVYGMNNSNALRVFSCTTSSLAPTSKLTPFAVMPLVECDLDTMMIEFYGRCFVHNSTTDKPVAVTYLTSVYGHDMRVGTMADPNDFSTFETLGTVQYTNLSLTTSTTMSSDPSGLEYWTKYQMPLEGVTSRYLAFAPATGGMFFIDNVSIKPCHELFTPQDLKTIATGVNDVDVQWKNWHKSAHTVIVLAFSNSEIKRDTLEPGINTYTFTGLQPNTEYTWYVKQFRDDKESQASVTKSFYTDCASVDRTFTTSFEEADGLRPYTGRTTEMTTACWTYGNAGSSAAFSATYFPFNRPKSASAQYALTGDYAVQLISYSTTYQGYVVSPMITEVDAYDSLQVNFWARPAVANPATNQIATDYTIATSSSKSYAKSIIVGTCDDPNDRSTFTPIETVTYNGTIAVGAEVNAANNYLFQPFSVKLAGATGKYIYFMSSLYDASEMKYTYNYMFLDDISISVVHDCTAPTDLAASNISASGATLSWTPDEHSIKHHVQVSSDPTFASDLVLDKELTESSVQLTGLKQHAQYYARIMAICSEDRGNSAWSYNYTFVTSRMPFYLDDFRDEILDADWKFASTPAANILNNSKVSLSGLHNVNYGWRRVTNGVGFESPHYAIPFFTSALVSTYRNYWMLTPSIAIEAGKQARLTFNLALTKATNYTPISGEVTAANIADDFMFMVAISEDGGETWKSSNTRVWGKGSDQKLTDIPAKGTEIEIDLTPYAGKSIKVGFYRETNTYLPSNCAIHIDNVRINNYLVQTSTETMCQYNDIDIYGFHVNGDTIPAGESYFNRAYLATEEENLVTNVPDTIFQLRTTYLAAKTTMINAVTCEGRPYSDNNFAPKSVSGIYKQKLIAQSTGCDSIVTLYLDVTPTAYGQTVEETICPGQSYTFAGQTFDRSGKYDVTLTSASGCDSIATLILHVLDADTIRESNIITIDDLPFTYYSITYPIGTPVGTYVDTVAIAKDNCSAVLIHTLTINPGTGLEELMQSGAWAEGVHKLIFREQLYIVRDGEWYDALGKSVKCPL